MTILTVALRMLRHTEALLGELDSSLAQAACHDVHNARLNLETLARIDARKERMA